MPRPVIGISFDHDREHSRYQLNYNYAKAILDAGGRPVALPFHDGLEEGLPEWIDGLLLTGGNDPDPASWGEAWHDACLRVDCDREKHERILLTEAERRGVGGLPVLAICLGTQLMNVVRGGSLIQHLPDLPERMEHRKDEAWSRRHPVEISPGSLLAGICGPGELEVNTNHHQGLGRVGEGLVVAATAPDGTIEAIEDPSKRLWLGVQWHPERHPDEPRHRALFGRLVEESAKPR